MKDLNNKNPALQNLQLEEVEEMFGFMKAKGYINKKLFNPRRTKREYFWLFMIHILVNILALIVEFVNGGVKTQKGLYVSWDVRLSSFFIGLIFLALYYKKYHVLKNLIHFQFCGCGYRNCPVIFGMKPDQPMQAIPDDDEMEKLLSDAKNMQTQTSVINLQNNDNAN